MWNAKVSGTRYMWIAEIAYCNERGDLAADPSSANSLRSLLDRARLT